MSVCSNERLLRDLSLQLHIFPSSREIQRILEKSTSFLLVWCFSFYAISSISLLDVRSPQRCQEDRRCASYRIVEYFRLTAQEDVQAKIEEVYCKSVLTWNGDCEMIFFYMKLCYVHIEVAHTVSIGKNI